VGHKIGMPSMMKQKIPGSVERDIFSK